MLSLDRSQNKPLVKPFLSLSFCLSLSLILCGAIPLPKMHRIAAVLCALVALAAADCPPISRPNTLFDDGLQCTTSSEGRSRKGAERKEREREERTTGDVAPLHALKIRRSRAPIVLLLLPSLSVPLPPPASLTFSARLSCCGPSCVFLHCSCSFRVCCGHRESFM